MTVARPLAASSRTVSDGDAGAVLSSVSVYITCCAGVRLPSASPALTTIGPDTMSVSDVAA
ncbi:Uncharacterised protein [Bordetella pertussis]|nr:Uncharacterised protein [Bordetella pertussis]CPO04392.1 Uncharacterised protein [Bordetella pertussis]